MEEELKDFTDYIDNKLEPALQRFQQAMKVDLIEPDEEDIQVLFDSYISYQA